MLARMSRTRPAGMPVSANQPNADAGPHGGSPRVLSRWAVAAAWPPTVPCRPMVAGGGPPNRVEPGRPSSWSQLAHPSVICMTYSLGCRQVAQDRSVLYSSRLLPRCTRCRQGWVGRQPKDERTPLDAASEPAAVVPRQFFHLNRLNRPLSTADLIIVGVSAPDSPVSKHLIDEWNRALTHGVPVHVGVVAGAKVPAKLARHPRHDLRVSPPS
jgi:hypothetical protein